MRNKFLRRLPRIAAAFILILFAVVGSGWLLSLVNRDGGVPPATAEITGAVPLPLGGAATAAAEFELPLWQRVVEVRVEPGAGSLQTGPLSLSRRWRWNRQRWRIAATLRAYRAGEIPAGAIKVRLSRRGGEAEECVIAIPPIAVREPKALRPGNELKYAGEVRDPAFRRRWKSFLAVLRRHPWIAAAAAILIAAAIAAAVLLLRRRALRRGAAAFSPPWERALTALDALRGELRGGRVSAERAAGRLADMVRGYLEERFRIPATRRTTPEFLRDLDREGTPLGAENRRFLREFMESADLIKFARLPAGAEMVEEAIGRAGELVRNTVPAAPEEEPSAAGAGGSGAPHGDAGPASAAERQGGVK